MRDQMLQQIDQLLAKRFEALSKNLDQKLEHQSEHFDRKLEHQSAEIERHTGVLLDGVQHKFDLIIGMGCSINST